MAKDLAGPGEWFAEIFGAGRQKTTQIGGSPPRAIAQLMLYELEEERLGNRMFEPPPG
jgi:hypothetical protein